MDELGWQHHRLWLSRHGMCVAARKEPAVPNSSGVCLRYSIEKPRRIGEFIFLGFGPIELLVSISFYFHVPKQD